MCEGINTGCIAGYLSSIDFITSLLAESKSIQSEATVRGHGASKQNLLSA